MKSKVFKFVLPAFAFALAIVASFAFTPGLNGVEESASLPGYVKNASTLNPCLQVTEQCVEGQAFACTTINNQIVEGVFIPAGTQIYKEATICNTPLTRAFP